MRLDGIEDLLGVHAIVRDGDGGYDGSLPGIQVVDLRDRNIEALAEPIFQALDDMPLLFERMRMLDVYIEGQDSNGRHGSDVYPFG